MIICEILSEDDLTKIILSDLLNTLGTRAIKFRARNLQRLVALVPGVPSVLKINMKRQNHV